MKKLFVEHSAVSGVSGWEAPPGPWRVPEGLGKQRYWVFHVGNKKFSVLLESAVAPRQWLQSKPSAALGNLQVLPCFMQELETMQPKAREYILHLPSTEDIGPVSMC